MTIESHFHDLDNQVFLKYIIPSELSYMADMQCISIPYYKFGGRLGSEWT